MITQVLQSDQIKALKTGQKSTLETLHYILAQIKNKEIEKQQSLTDEEVIVILRKIAKELRESIGSFIKGGRLDLVREYQIQLDLVSGYLPKEITDEQLQKAVRELIVQNQDLYNNNPKSLIGICIKKLKDQADPGRITKAVLTHEIK